MAMIKCEECGKEISSKATVCPNCGCPIIEENSENSNINNEQNNTEKYSVNRTSGGGAIFAIIVGIIIFVICFSISNGDKDDKVENKKCNSSECNWAAKKALEDIPELAHVWDTVKSNELKCEPNSITDDEIILVKCTTTHEDVIDYYKSSTIWYGYLESADGNSYFRWADKDSNVVLEKLRK